jgi:hydrogenase nickel incorporation protein HypB
MKRIEVIKNILEANDSMAAQNQQLLDRNGVFAINIMAAPGAGKTSLILQTIAKLKEKLRIAVIEGDVASTLDSEKVRNEVADVVQINTQNMSESCALIANMVSHALSRLPLGDIDLLLIENVGNLICPSEFALGEHKRVVVSSLPEGDDKPAKYPVIFSDADAVVINKLDFLPYVEFDIDSFQIALRRLNPRIEILQVSCKTGAGIEDWCAWLLKELETNKHKLRTKK